MKIVHSMIVAAGLVGLALAMIQLQDSRAASQSPQAEAKWLIVNYWSEWCAPCRLEIPVLNALNETLSSTNVTIVGVNFDEDPQGITLSIAADMGIEFPTLAMDVVAEFKLRAPDVLPTTYILSPAREVVAKMIGAQTEESLLAQLASLNLPVEKD
ncbi:MAG TPA: TlpA family protein disulfide reductase [Gammaproteobacteria bacterium]|nr:TlpA family protein disulfide reductase [Gammaproteobacteria bacterium]HIL64026.1 TlpA family protein disulfide reductase [Porticoccaceae bacterium]